MKKVFMCLVVVGVMLLAFTGCTTTKSFTYSVETGDSVKITLNTSDGYDLSSELPFKVSKDGETLSQGTFIQSEYYEQYVSLAETDASCKVIDSGSDENIEYVFYSVNDSEYDYVVKIKNSNTAVAIGNQHSQDEAEKCFELLTFSVED